MKRKIVSTLILIILLFNASIIGYIYKDSVIDFVDIVKRTPSVLKKNNYINSVEPNSFNITDDFEPESYDELINIYYTVLSSGMNEFTFYCSKEYENCIEDIKKITSDDKTLSAINNFVHTFNSFKKIRTKYSENGKVTLIVEKLYDETIINEITLKLDEIFYDIYKEKKSVKDNIKAIHNYIINNTKYDMDYVNENSLISSNTAYGPLFNNEAICSGYTDLMSLFLYKMNIPNYKISNDKHVWNYVYIDGKWLHLDLTWDDPVQPDNKNILRYFFFLIEADELTEYDEDSEHVFDKLMYEKN